MVEIFTAQRDGDGQSVRQVTTDLHLSQPADVYFGQAAAGIAFYEKSGPDLLVTLLDGSEVVLRDFFVIGEGGGFSRLLLAEGGTVEITGLVAPEPLIPGGAAPATIEVAAPEPAPEPAPAPAPVPAAPEPVMAAPVAAAAPPLEMAGSAGGAESAGGFDSPGAFEPAVPGGGQPVAFGMAMDQLLFLGGMVPVAATIALDKDDERDDPPFEAATGGGTAEEEDDAEDGDADDGDIAALLAGADEEGVAALTGDSDPGEGLGDAPEGGAPDGFLPEDPVLAALDTADPNGF